MRKFEIVSKYADSNLSLPQRATTHSAGYDFCAAEDIIIPSLIKRNNMSATAVAFIGNCDLKQSAEVIKDLGIKPTLVPTGIKCALNEDEYLELCVRSSLSLKNLLICANGVGRL